jgi:hypothetical protein
VRRNSEDTGHAQSRFRVTSQTLGSEHLRRGPCSSWHASAAALCIFFNQSLKEPYSRSCIVSGLTLDLVQYVPDSCLPRYAVNMFRSCRVS